ncbi:AAA family ATPase [Telmatospirillum sp. J64-1]|uniref:AAA family ATPase n=1 Tax=Telmatospirillum sp. J64-1 TaxID=2502183 RepID=UPI00115DC92A|nr:AAA family ATPase [Telmatospirillum sp. J64-1]
MYRDFYNLSAEPFRITPDPDFLFLTEQYKEALAAIVYGIEQRKGFVCITGEVGTGKTTILRSYLEGVDKQNIKFVYVFNPTMPFHRLLRTILQELELTPASDDVTDMVDQLHEYLIEMYRQNINVVLFVDEAHNMHVGTLERLRMLSNLETASDKLIQIVLVGQPELEDLLGQHELRQLKSRIAVKARLNPMNVNECIEYIEHRLRLVAQDEKPIFTKGAMALVARHAQGIPRIINVTCDNALITGFGYKRRPVTESIVREVIRDTGEKPPSRFSLPGMAMAAGVAGLALAGGFGWWALQDRGEGQAVAAAMEERLLPETAVGADLAEAPRETAAPPQVAASAGWRSEIPRIEGVLEERFEERAVASAPLERPVARPLSASLPSLPTRGDEVRPAADSVPVFEETVLRVVEPGDTLSGLMVEIYGRWDRPLLEMVRNRNPQIINVDRLIVGQVLRFPPAPMDLASAGDGEENAR